MLNLVIKNMWFEKLIVGQNRTYWSATRAPKQSRATRATKRRTEPALELSALPTIFHLTPLKDDLNLIPQRAPASAPSGRIKQRLLFQQLRLKTARRLPLRPCNQYCRCGILPGVAISKAASVAPRRRRRSLLIAGFANTISNLSPLLALISSRDVLEITSIAVGFTSPSVVLFHTPPKYG